MPTQTDLPAQIKELLSQGKTEEVAEILEQLFEQTKDISFLYDKVKLYTDAKDYKSLVKTRKKIAKVCNTLSNIKNLAYYSLIIGKYKDALKYYLQILECEGCTAENNFNIGCCYYLLKMPQEAEDYYKQALTINPCHLQTLNNLAVVYYENGNWEDAVFLLKTALDISTNNAETFHHLGVVYRDYVKDYELSELYLRKAIYYDRPHAENYYQLALTYMAEKQYQKAFENAQECLSRNSQDKKAKKLFKDLEKKLKKTKKTL